MTKKRGFTLIELLVVITIIGILMTLITVSIASVQRKSRDSRRKADISLMRGSLDLFKADFKIYPNFTFYLGDNKDESGIPVDRGAVNSAFDLEPSIKQCTALPSGKPELFASDTNYDTATLLEGFDSINAFLICLKYAEAPVRDPSAATDTPANYQYRVSADYADMIVSAKLENANDLSAESLFNVNLTNKRYIEGSGKTSRQLADDSSTGVFYPSLGGGNVNDGLYLYQCLKDALDVDISRDNRSGATYQPIIFEGTSWKTNSNCQDAVAGLHVVQSYGRKSAGGAGGSL